MLLTDALVGCEDVRLKDVLDDQKRDTLKELCEHFGLDKSGVERAPLVTRLLEACGDGDC